MACRCLQLIYPAFALLLLLVPPATVPFAAADDRGILERQEEQLQRLRALVESLSDTVSRLESTVATPRPKLPPSDRTGANTGGDRVTVTQIKPLWSERFQLLAAARLEAEPTSAVALPYTGADGLAKYIAVGDAAGGVYVFSSSGDVLLEPTELSEASPVTAMLCYLSLRRNESLLFSAYADGSIILRRVWESPGAVGADDWPALSTSQSEIFFQGGRGSHPIAMLEVHHVGRARFVVSSDEGGRIRVFTENGTQHGTAVLSSKPLVFLKQRLLFLTETGTGSLDLRRMIIREMECQGLNGSVVESYALDASDRTKAYGFTSGGDLVLVLLIVEAGSLKCRVRSVRRSDIAAPLSLIAIKGYLLAANHEKVVLYNVSSSQYYNRMGVLRPVFSAALNELRSLFLSTHAHSQPSDETVHGRPLISGDREKLVILGLGSGYVGFYRSNFPVFKAHSSAVLWSSPALLFVIFLIGGWYMYVKKKGLTLWTPEETLAAVPASPAPTTGLLNPAVGERAYAEGQRASDLRDMGMGLLRGPTRRYASPSSRYPGRTSVQYRQGSSEAGFTSTTELTYRGQTLEPPPGFPKRREPIFTNSQALEDHID